MTLPSKPGQIFALLVIAIVSTGCESAPKPEVPVQAVSIKADTFCPVMRKLRPPDGIPTWDTADSQETIDYNRRLEAVVVKKCLASRPPANNSTP